MRNFAPSAAFPIILTDQMFIPAQEAVFLLPAKTPYEQDDGGTETSTEGRVMFSPEIPRQVGEAKAEWKILRALAVAAYPEKADLMGCETSLAVECAQSAGISLAGFLRPTRANVYTGFQRVSR
jgi:hypothetical protein